MTVIDSANIRRHSVTRNRLRWVGYKLLDLTIVTVVFVGLLVVINMIETVGR